MQLPTGNITKKNLELVTRFATQFCNSRIIDLHIRIWAYIMLLTQRSFENGKTSKTCNTISLTEKST